MHVLVREHVRELQDRKRRGGNKVTEKESKGQIEREREREIEK